MGIGMEKCKDRAKMDGYMDDAGWRSPAGEVWPEKYKDKKN